VSTVNINADQRDSPVRLKPDTTPEEARRCNEAYYFQFLQGDNTTGPVPSQMGKASSTTITTTKVITRTAFFAGLDLMDASLPDQAGSIQER
jgi:hypothetical protein